jgi:hypothetical protein
MFNFNKTVLATLSLLSMIALSPINVFAQSYGNTPNTPSYCLNIDQMVSNPAVTKTIEYIDNIISIHKRKYLQMAILTFVKKEQLLTQINSLMMLLTEPYSSNS